MFIIESKEGSDESGVKIYIEVDQEPGTASVYDDTRGVADRVVSQVDNLFNEGLDLARTCAAQVAQTFKTIDEAICPDEFEAQLAIKLSAELGSAVLTKLGGEAQIQVKMKWLLKK